VSAPCFGWGRQGHQIVGAIAANHLSAEARRGVVDLLGYDDLSSAGYWADEIRSNPAYDWAKPLHYINVPRDATTVDLSRDCPTGECVIQAIKKYAAIVGDQKRTKDERAEALKFLAHFVGDVHQPLHVSFAVDRGGNSITVTAFDNASTNLHAVWDTALIEHRTRGDWAKLANDIDAAMTKSQRADWEAPSDATDWANASLAITQRVYRELPANATVGEIYYDRHIGIIEDQLAAAGIRLATMLNTIFASPAPASAASSGAATGAAEPPAAVAPVSPRVVDLRDTLSSLGLPPRGQGSRGTCSVFTTCAAIEFALAKHRGRASRLSVEFLNWAANQAAGRPSDGAYFHDALAGFARFGICSEDAMPYRAQFDASVAPSPAATAEAALVRDEAATALTVHWIVPWQPNRFGLNDEQFAEIKSVLARGFPVAAGSGHSRLLVGWRDDAALPGGGAFTTLDSALARFDEVSNEFVRAKVADVFWIEAK